MIKSLEEKMIEQKSKGRLYNGDADEWENSMASQPQEE